MAPKTMVLIVVLTLMYVMCLSAEQIDCTINEKELATDRRDPRCLSAPLDDRLPGLAPVPAPTEGFGLV